MEIVQKMLPARYRDTTGFFVYKVFGPLLKGLGPDTETLKSGTPGQATILRVWQTGTMVNYNPQIGMQLEVRPQFGAAYQTQTTMVVPMVNIPQFQPGIVVPVKISAKDPSKVVLDVYAK